jgi:hypothetical protein
MSRGDAWGFQPWTPTPNVAAVVDQALAIFDEYEAQRPLTIRQVFYRLVAAHGFDKTEQAYRRLGYYLDRARRAQVIPFGWVRDDGIRGDSNGYVPADAQSPEDWLADYLRMQQWEYLNYGVLSRTGQPRRVELWCEAGGMHGQMEHIASRYGWPAYSGGGAESMTARYQLAERCAYQPDLPTDVLYVGDHDDAGQDIFNALSTDTAAFVADLAPEAEVTFTRAAVTPEQIAEHDLPTAPAKPGARHGTTTCQAGALPPDLLARIVGDALRDHTDMEARASTKQRGDDGREWLRVEFERRFGDAP